MAWERFWSSRLLRQVRPWRAYVEDRAPEHETARAEPRLADQEELVHGQVGGEERDLSRSGRLELLEPA